jgi:hypothetical protein
MPHEAFPAEKMYIVHYLGWLVTFRWKLLAQSFDGDFVTAEAPSKFETSSGSQV